MRDHQRILTENVYSAGLTRYSAALMVNRRFANLSEGVPNFMYNWGEDSIMRERHVRATRPPGRLGAPSGRVAGRAGRGRLAPMTGEGAACRVPRRVRVWDGWPISLSAAAHKG